MVREVKNRGLFGYKKGMKNTSNSANGNSAVAAIFNPATFKAAPQMAPVSVFWGNGHTRDTDPIQQGWRCRPVGTCGDLWLVGQPGKAGCASICINPLRPEVMDVAVYFETPKEIHAWLMAPRASRDFVDGRFVDVPAIGGAGLRIIAEILKERAMAVPS